LGSPTIEEKERKKERAMPRDFTPNDVSLTDLTSANRANWDERAAIHFRDATGFYAVDRFRAGEDTLIAIESAEIGDVSGKRLAHLQCHIGLDTLCLARRGAVVTGLDYSRTAIEAARALAAEADLPAEFVQADVYDASRVLEGPFDVVYVTWGSLNWLPDIEAWARVAADLLAPGGFLYLAEIHPYISVMTQVHGRLEQAYGWRTPPQEPVVTEAGVTYTGDGARLANRRLHEWEHPLSEIIGGLLGAGLRLDFFHEHELLPWPRFPMMRLAGDRLYCMPKSLPPMPLSFSLRASKPK
jgi:2-polyprenyl-3-methyl-5-hydroxy-6-metoxy-1,4-benzoquinol methylase